MLEGRTKADGKWGGWYRVREDWWDEETKTTILRPLMKWGWDRITVQMNSGLKIQYRLKK